MNARIMSEKGFTRHKELNFEGPESLYKQLYAIVKRDIENGILKAGEKIPPEVWFVEHFKISRVTVRKSMEMLTEEDLIVKSFGKGSFVRPKKIQDSIRGDLSFSLTCQVNNVAPFSKVITQDWQDPNETDVSELGISAGERLVYIKRIRYADGNPVIIENVFMKEQFDYLLNMNLTEKSLYDLVSKRYSFESDRTVRSIEISRATQSQAELLELKDGDPIMLYRELIFDDTGNPLFRIKQVIAGERVRFIAHNR